MRAFTKRDDQAGDAIALAAGHVVDFELAGRESNPRWAKFREELESEIEWTERK